MPPPDPTPPLRVIIVDDEPLARDAIRLALERAGGVEVVAQCGDGEQAVQAIVAGDPDLVFLDIQMPGADGFDVIATVGPDRMPPVVFVTAYDAHALRAFEVHALDYVLKPFDDQRLLDAVARVRERRSLEAQEGTARALAALLQESTAQSPGTGHARRIMVEQDERIRFVPVDRVTHLEASGNYVVVHAATGTHRVRSTLTSLLARLSPRDFIRIHRSTAVNLNHIREVQPWFGGDYVAILEDGRQLKVSRRFREQLLRQTL